MSIRKSIGIIELSEIFSDINLKYYKLQIYIKKKLKNYKKYWSAIMKDIIKRKDVILIVVVLIVAAIGFGAKFLFAEKGGTVTISVDGKTYGTYSLDEDKTINVDDHNKVVIKDGVVHMEDADCPDKLCIKQGKIDSNGQKIVCLPNKTIVEVSSEKESDYDVKVK